MKLSRFFLPLLTALTAAIINFSAFADEVVGMAKPWQKGMFEGVSPVMERLNGFHNYLLVIITAVSLFVLALMIYVCVRFNEKANPVPSKTTHNVKLEIIWTLLPVVILVSIAIPSLRTIYYMDRTANPDMTLKVVGYQWYWNYEYPDQGGFKFDSYMVKEADLKEGEPRLLTVDNPLVLPVGKKIRLQTTGGDVIHSWAMPFVGVKIDAVPGQLNETWFEIDKPGVYHGQCSELCGQGHGFMPITIHAVSEADFNAWVAEAKVKFASADIATPLVAAAQ